MCSPCPCGPDGINTVPNGRPCVDLARSEDRRPRQIFGFLKNLGTVFLSHSRPVPVGAVATIVPRLPGRVVRVNMWLATQIQGRGG